jgi:Mg2+ and Co2+ transporter CorA
MRESLEILKHISLQGREENAKLTKVSTQSYKDSRMLKALTIVATMYLPATFLAVC